MDYSSSQKSVTRQISWKNHAVGYLLSVLLVPLFGIGLVGLYWTWKRQHRVKYEMSDTQIASIDDLYRRNVDLFSIRRVEVVQSWLQEQLSVGDVHLQTSASELILYGMDDPYQLKGILEKAIAAEKELRQEEQKSPEPRKPEYGPGQMERINYLTGLWQQGLLSDEDYEKERRELEE
ncbi:MAG TPA: hypothetical protein VK112_00945 [Fodinibius sp.]|nr:hypothetical protein [Fodinibius sp.]